MKHNIRLWLFIIRPGTLAAGASPVFIGLMVAHQMGSSNWLVALVTFLAAIAIQIASNLINDYYDFKKGLDKAGRLGPSRALAEGKVSQQSMLIAIIIDLLFAIVCGAYLVWVGGIPILLIGVFALFFAWLYTATSYSLSYLGIADLFVLLFFGPLATTGTTYLQTNQFSETSFWLGLVCGFISMGVLTVNNLRDRKTDLAAGKKSLVVRFGKRFGELEYLILFLLIAPCLYAAQAPILSYGVVIYGFMLYLKLTKTEGKRYNQLLILTSQGNLVFALLYWLGGYIG